MGWLNIDWLIESPVITTVVTLTATIFLAFAGYLITYANNLRLQRRKDKLERLNRQLKYLYGPLYVLAHSSKIAWQAFRSEYRPDFNYWTEENPPTEEEADAYRLWMSEVFIPFHKRMEKAILENADLLEDDEIPECLLLLTAHISCCKTILKRWALSDFSKHVSIIAFPGHLIEDYSKESYYLLKNKQAKLLGTQRPKWWPKKA